MGRGIPGPMRSRAHLFPFALIVLSLPPYPVRAATTVRVAVCQVEAVDGDVAGNLARMDSCAQRAAGAGAKIAVFPELVDTGFENIVRAPTGGEHARAIPGETSGKIGAMAAKYDLWI